MAASNTTVGKGTLFQTLIMHSDTMAHPGSSSHGTGPIPTQPSMVLSSPLSVLNTNCHITAVTTDDTARGTKTTARKTLIPLSFRFSRAATTRLMSTAGTGVPVVKRGG